MVSGIPAGQFLVVTKGVGDHVCLAFYEGNPDGSIGALAGGVSLTPEQARVIASKLTWESMQVEEGRR